MRQSGLGHPAQNGVRFDRGPFLPAEPAGDDVAGAPLGMPGFGDGSDGERAHRRTDRDRRGIIADVGDPAAHGGLDRQEFVAHEHGSLGERLDRNLPNGEILRLRDAGRTRDEDDLAVVHGRLPKTTVSIRLASGSSQTLGARLARRLQCLRSDPLAFLSVGLERAANL